MNEFFTSRVEVRAAGRRAGASLLLASAALLVALGRWDAALEFDRTAIAAGQWWRLMTGHWSHFGLDHLAWDLAVFAALGIACEARSRRAMLMGVAGSGLAISVAVAIVEPEVQVYRGLSGIDSALLALLVAQRLPNLLASGRRTASAALGGVSLLFIMKTAFEFATGAALFVDHGTAGFTPLPLAHLVGTAWGLLVGLLSWVTWDQQTSRQTTRGTTWQDQTDGPRTGCDDRGRPLLPLAG